MRVKAFWRSKTFWINAITLGLGVARPVLGIETIPEADPSLLAVANLILRAVTDKAVGLKDN